MSRVDAATVDAVVAAAVAAADADAATTTTAADAARPRAITGRGWRTDAAVYGYIKHYLQLAIFDLYTHI